MNEVRRGDCGAAGEEQNTEKEGQGEEGIWMISRDKRQEMEDELHPVTLNEI